MAFSRNSMVAAVAGTLSLAMLTGCPNPNQPAPGTGASAAPTAAPTTGATTEPTAAPSGAPASVTPSASTLTPTTLRGKVYDEDGAVVNNASVSVKSLNPSNPFETTVQVVNGSYVANEVPAGVQLEITASKENWTSRTRVETLLPLLANDPSGNVVDFGGTNANDKEGQAYFVSDWPEVASTEPMDDADNVDPTKIVVKLTLSEALDEDNQDRFADAIRVAPANKYATSGGTGTAPMIAATDTTVPYEVEGGDSFLDTDNLAKVTWDADGRVATLEFTAPYLQSKDGKAEYQIALRSESADTIEDGAGNQLGSGSATDAGADYNSGEWILNAFKQTSLSIDTANDTSADKRWVATHQNSVAFEVPEDDTDPTITGVAVTGDRVITLTFSEPMAAYAGDTPASNNVVSLEKYSFVVGEDQDEVDDDEWASNEATLTADTFASVTESGYFGKPFTFTTDGTNDITIELDDNDAKVVRITAPSNDKFVSKAGAIRVRVDSSVADPAGNGVKTTNDANFVLGEF